MNTYTDINIFPYILYVVDYGLIKMNLRTTTFNHMMYVNDQRRLNPRTSDSFSCNNAPRLLCLFMSAHKRPWPDISSMTKPDHRRQTL